MKYAAAFLMLCAVALRAGEAPPTILSTALATAEKISIPRLPKEENLTAQSMQLEQLSALFARAGRTERALRMIEGLETEDRVIPQAFVPLAVAAIRAGDAKRAKALIKRVSSIEEWTTPGALADIALAMYAAGDEAGAVRLAQRIENGREQFRALFGMKHFVEALPAASAIAAESFHIPYPDGSSRWELDYDGSLNALLQLVTVFVDRGDLRSAHNAFDAMTEVQDRDTPVYRARALLEIARREEAVPALRQALEELQYAFDERPGERHDHAETLARIAEAMAAAGERASAGPLIAEAVELMGPADSVEQLWMASTIVCEALARIARAHFILGEREQALALLERAAHLADTLPVPSSGTAGGWDDPSSVRQHKVESLARVAVELELGGESKKAAEVLGRAIAGIDAISSAEWRGYAWRAIVKAYADAGRLDRAIDILATGKPANEDKTYAFEYVTDDALLAAGRERRWRLLAALPAGWPKVEVEARLARRLEDEGNAAEAKLLVADALASLGKYGWEWDLMRLATLAPGVDKPGDAEQQRILRGLLAKLPRRK